MRRSNKVLATIISTITCSVIDFSSKPCFDEKQSFYIFMYKFDVISFFSYIITSEATLVTSPSFNKLHHLQGKQKVKEFNSSKEKINQTTQKQSFKSKSKLNITKWVFISEKLEFYVYKPFVMFKNFTCIQGRKSEQEKGQKLQRRQKKSQQLGHF